MFNTFFSFFRSKNSRFLAKKQALKLVPYHISKNYLRLDLLNENKIEIAKDLNVDFIFTTNTIEKINSLKEIIEKELKYLFNTAVTSKCRSTDNSTTNRQKRRTKTPVLRKINRAASRTQANAFAPHLILPNRTQSPPLPN